MGIILRPCSMMLRLLRQGITIYEDGGGGGGGFWGSGSMREWIMVEDKWRSGYSCYHLSITIFAFGGDNCHSPR